MSKKLLAGGFGPAVLDQRQ